MRYSRKEISAVDGRIGRIKWLNICPKSMAVDQYSSHLTINRVMERNIEIIAE